MSGSFLARLGRRTTTVCSGRASSACLNPRRFGTRGNPYGRCCLGLEPAASAVTVPSGTLHITNLHVDSEFVEAETMSRQSTRTNNRLRIRWYPSGNLMVCCGPASRFAGRARCSDLPIPSLRKPEPESESQRAASSANFPLALQSRKPGR